MVDTGRNRREPLHLQFRHRLAHQRHRRPPQQKPCHQSQSRQLCHLTFQAEMSSKVSSLRCPLPIKKDLTNTFCTLKCRKDMSLQTFIYQLSLLHVKLLKVLRMCAWQAFSNLNASSNHADQQKEVKSPVEYHPRSLRYPQLYQTAPAVVKSSARQSVSPPLSTKPASAKTLQEKSAGQKSG